MNLNGRDVTVDTVVAVKREALDAFRAGDRTVNFDAVGRLDSSAVSLLLALLRRYPELRIRYPELRIENAPEDLRTLARLYGVHELFAGNGL